MPTERVQRRIDRLLDQVAELQDEAIAIATELGMKPLLERVLAQREILKVWGRHVRKISSIQFWAGDAVGGRRTGWRPGPPDSGPPGAASQSPFSVTIWTVSTGSLCYGIHRKTRDAAASVIAPQLQAHLAGKVTEEPTRRLFTVTEP